MALTQEMFRFVTTRRTERVMMNRIASRLMRDRRPTATESVLAKLFGPGTYETKLATAETLAASAEFVAPGDAALLAIEPAATFLREALVPDVAIADLGAELRRRLPVLAMLLQHTPPGELVESAQQMSSRLWNSLYVQTIRGCHRYVRTNYLVDTLRVYHVLRLLWLSAKLGLSHWAGVAFDDYHALIDLNAALAAADGAEAVLPDGEPLLQQYVELNVLSERLMFIDAAAADIARLLRAGAVQTSRTGGRAQTFFDADAVRILRELPALAGLELAAMPVEHVQKRLRVDRELTGLQRQRAFAAVLEPTAASNFRQLAGHAIASRAPAKVLDASLSSLAATDGEFRVPLAVGAIKPPLVGDLILVEQELRRYGFGELAEIETIMRGERRERTIRKLNRTSQTTTTESVLEQEESSVFRTDERFQLSSEAQKTAQESFGIQAGVNVSGKFGPVQIGVSVNASYDTSKSSSESTSQEYAKTIVEEATKRLKNSIKETSSITILTETQDTSLRGFNNEKGSAHVNGLYRWVDKVEEARLLNYGRRMMLPLAVPEPSAFYRALLKQSEAEALADLAEPVPPSRVHTLWVTPLSDDAPTGGFNGFTSYEDLNEEGFWRDLFGYSHAIVVASAFYENVNRHRMEGRELAPGEALENVVLEFRPQSSHDMLVACLWSRWTAPGESELLSFAAITDEPPPEVAAAGHDRCIIPIRPEYVDAWLSPDPSNLRALHDILEDRERPYYEHRLAA